VTASAVHRLGARGEDVAARYLVRAGYEILDRNWRAGRLELDLVARDGHTVVFVEVKTRSPGVQMPIEALSAAQRRRLVRAAGAWIGRHPRIGREFRFDLIGIRPRETGLAEIDHIAGAFTGDDR